MRQRIKTNPDHKARFNFGVRATCLCGWEGVFWLGKGARGNASGEWRWHREKCENAAQEDAKRSA